MSALSLQPAAPEPVDRIEPNHGLDLTNPVDLLDDRDNGPLMSLAGVRFHNTHPGVADLSPGGDDCSRYSSCASDLVGASTRSRSGEIAGDLLESGKPAGHQRAALGPQCGGLSSYQRRQPALAGTLLDWIYFVIDIWSRTLA